jgi:lipoprotein-releasing system permease protein
LIQGRFPEVSQEISTEILISETVARQLNLEIGDRTEAFFQNKDQEGLPNRRRFTVSGIYFSGFPDIDQNLIYGDLRQVQGLNRWKPNEIGAYEVFVKIFHKFQKTSNRIYNFSF